MSIVDHDLYTDPGIQFKACDIYEYDMASAGLSISRLLKLLPEETILELSKMPKTQRNVKLGILQREDKIFKENLKNGFKYFRNRFFELNQLKDSDIVSVKKDAIFTTAYCTNTQIGVSDNDTETLEFKLKNEYSSILILDLKGYGKIQFYKNDNRIDVKGLRDEFVETQMQETIKVINRVMTLLEEYDKEGSIKYIVDQMSSAIELSTEYYEMGINIGLHVQVLVSLINMIV